MADDREQYMRALAYSQRKSTAWQDVFAVLLIMRLRIPELLDARGLTPYFLSQKSKGRISLSTAYRLRRQKGRLKMFDADLLDALCELLQVGPGELFEGPGSRKDGSIREK